MKLNATFFFQLVNFFITYWILKHFLLKHALTFLFSSKQTTKEHSGHLNRLEKKEAKLTKEHETLISNFKEKIQHKNIPLLQKNQLLPKKEISFTVPSVTTETINRTTEQLKNFIKKECL